MRPLFRLLLILSLLGLAVPALAQTATSEAPNHPTIAIGNTVTGTLSSTQPSITYSLQADSGQTINILLNSDAFDAYVTLKDGDGNVLAENDDLTGSNAGIQNFALPDSSSYSIVAESYGNHENSGAETGAFTLSVTGPSTTHIQPTAPPTEAATSEAASQTIAVGDTVNGTLTTSQPSITYTLQAEAGQAINIALNSDAFDAYMILKDGNGKILAENDDLTGSNAGIQNFVLPDSSSYSIVAESYGNYEDSGAETGDFTLTVTAPHIAHIEYSQTLQDNLTTAEGSKDYVFTGQEGDVIVATESSTDSNFDAYLHLLDSTGSELTSNDDTGGSLDAMIGPYTLTSTGTYTLRATTIDGSTAGAFSLALSKVSLTALDYDQPVTVSFTPKQTAQYFTFAGSAGDLVSIEADSKQSIDTSLTLNDSNNSQVASDADGGAGFDPEIYKQLLTTTGTYTILLQAVAPGTGSVSLSVTHTAPPSLDEGSQTISLSDTKTAGAVSFTAKAGSTVRLSFHVSAGDAGSPSVTVTQGDSTLASASGSTVTDLNFSFKTTSDGPVIVQITDYSYTNLTYEVSLSQSSE